MRLLTANNEQSNVFFNPTEFLKSQLRKPHNSLSSKLSQKTETVHISFCLYSFKTPSSAWGAQIVLTKMN